MDALADVLDALDLRGSLCSRTEIAAPWRFHFTASVDAMFHVVNFGRGYLLVEGEPAPRPLADGDVVLLPHGHAHSICDAPASPLLKTTTMTYGDGTHLHVDVYPFEGEGLSTLLLCGLFHFAHPREHPLLDFLPTVIRIPGHHGHAAAGLRATLDLIAAESQGNRPGAEALLRRLTEMLFIQIVRAWVEEQPPGSSGWLAALCHPQIGAALGLIHGRPEQVWTVESLAHAVALSRSAFAARFKELVGEPPISYLARRRFQGAARLLQSGADIAAVARWAGYQSDVAFRKAFARELGIAPGRYRRQAARGIQRSSPRHDI